MLFATVNIQWSKINQYLLPNKLSPNITKARYSFSYKTSKKSNISLILRRLQITNYNTERIGSIKFPGVLLDENLYGKTTLNIPKKFSKNIGVLYKARDSLSKQSLLWLYYESRCCHLKNIYRVCFKQGVPWNSGNHRVYVHSKTRTWHVITYSYTMPIFTHT